MTTPQPDIPSRGSDRGLNKYSSPKEVLAHYEGWNVNQSLEGHIARFYPLEPIGSGLTQPTLERIIRSLSTKAMEAL